MQKMQTSKQITGCSEAPNKKQTQRQIKKSSPDTDPASSPKVNKISGSRSPRVRLSISPVTKKRISSTRLLELECQLTQLEEDLKKAKDQLNASESWKRRAQREADDTKRQLMTLSTTLKESQRQLLELSSSEDAGNKVHALEPEAFDKTLQKQLVDSVCDEADMNEVDKLRDHLGVAAESEASSSKRKAEFAESELQDLMRNEFSENLSLLEKMNDKVADSEAMNSLQEMCRKSQREDGDCRNQMDETGIFPPKRETLENGETEETIRLKKEVQTLKCELDLLRYSLESSETKLQEESIKKVLQIQSAYEQCELSKSMATQHIAELEAELKKSKSALNDEETNKERLTDELSRLKKCLSQKEERLKSLIEENETLKIEILKQESRRSRDSEEEEADGTRLVSADMELELRKLKIQSLQWRKAAEAAAAMISTENDGKSVEKKTTLDASFGSACWEDMDGASPRRKNGKMLKKIGVLWKKGQK